MLATPVDDSENAKHKKVETASPGDKQLFRSLLSGKKEHAYSVYKDDDP